MRGGGSAGRGARLDRQGLRIAAPGLRDEPEGAAGLRHVGDRALQAPAGRRVPRIPAAHRDRQAAALQAAGAGEVNEGLVAQAA